MGKPRQRAVDILGLQHQSGGCGSRGSRRTSKEPIGNGGRPTTELPVKDFIMANGCSIETGARITSACIQPPDVRCGSILLKKSFLADERNFSAPPVRPTRATCEG